MKPKKIKNNMEDDMMKYLEKAKKEVMQEKVENILGEFLERNKNYTIEVYTRIINTDFLLGKVYISTDRKWGTKEEKEYIVSWDDNSNHFIIPYDEISACYEEVDEYNQQMVCVMLKCGISIDFECVGLR